VHARFVRKGTSHPCRQGRCGGSPPSAKLCVQEYLNFELGIITRYGYEVSRAHVLPDAPDFPAAGEYCRATDPHKDRLYWYGSFLTRPIPPWPAPIPTTSMCRHIKPHRVPAPELSFTRPNLPFLIEEIERLVLQGPLFEQGCQGAGEPG
jgi:hypothetical protein